MIFRDFVMSKKTGSHKAKSAFTWRERLRRFAAGEIFGRGECSAKGSVWYSHVERIKACPAHKNARIACVCQYHATVSCSNMNSYSISN